MASARAQSLSFRAWMRSSMRRFDLFRGDFQVRGLLAQGLDHGLGVGLEQVQHPAQAHQGMVGLPENGEVAGIARRVPPAGG